MRIEDLLRGDELQETPNALPKNFGGLTFGDLRKDKYSAGNGVLTFGDLRVHSAQTKEAAPGTLSFIADNLAADLGNALESALRPENKTPTEWHEQRGTFIRALQDEGRDMRERNTHYYEPQSLDYYGSLILQSAPETLIDMGLSAAVGSALGGLFTGAASKINTGRKLLEGLYTAYNSAGKGGKILRAVTPNRYSLPAGLTGAGLESWSEAQRAADDYIADAKRNGTYVPNQTEIAYSKIRRGKILGQALITLCVRLFNKNRTELHKLLLTARALNYAAEIFLVWKIMICLLLKWKTQLVGNSPANRRRAEN